MPRNNHYLKLKFKKYNHIPKNNRYILKDKVVGEVINVNKQMKTEIQPILSDKCGEMFMPHLKKNLIY